MRIFVSAAAVALVAGCTPSTAAPQPAAPAGAADYRVALDRLAALPTAPVDTGTHYRRDDWRHWVGQGGGCDTREVMLRRQGSNPAGEVVFDAGTCRPLSGHGNSWVSVYDGVVASDPAQLDVDHIVPLEEAARSGTRAWSADQRQRYANDPEVLLVVSARSNRAKGSQDPARWLPPAQGFVCRYLVLWVGVKTKYGIAVDQVERDVVAGRLSRCG